MASRHEGLQAEPGRSSYPRHAFTFPAAEEAFADDARGREPDLVDFFTD